MTSPRVALGLLVSLFALGACAPAPQPLRPAEELLVCTEAIFRPTADGASLHWVASEPIDARVSWGAHPDALEFVQEFECEGPTEFDLHGLAAEPRAYFQLEVRPRGASEYSARPLRSFHTARTEGETYRVALIADSHVYALHTAPGSRENLRVAMQRCLEDELDFVVFLGDEAGVHFYNDSVQTINAEAALERWSFWRRTYTPLLEAVPSFMVLGNHEGEAGYYRELQRPKGVLNLQRWGTVARKQYLLNPLPTTYPEGGEDGDFRELGAPEVEGPFSNCSPLQNYYAWTWGDALFVVLDAHRYTEGKPAPGGAVTPASEVQVGVEDWTLGADQLAWLEATLEASDAKHKLVFAHHLVGGWGFDLEGLDPDAIYKYGRGGARYARKGEQAKITSLMNEHGARYFFYGHDHVFAHQSAESVEFVCCGRPSFLQPRWWRAPGWKEAYGNLKSRSAKEFLATIGYTRLTIGPERVVIEYVRTATQPVRGENAGPTPDGVVYRWDSTQPSPLVELVD